MLLFDTLITLVDVSSSTNDDESNIADETIVLGNFLIINDDAHDKYLEKIG